MERPSRRVLIAISTAAMLAGLVPATAALLSAQVRKCYLEICSTKNGVTTCYEKEVTCPNES